MNVYKSKCIREMRWLLFAHSDFLFLGHCLDLAKPRVLYDDTGGLVCRILGLQTLPQDYQTERENRVKLDPNRCLMRALGSREAELRSVQGDSIVYHCYYRP